MPQPSNDVLHWLSIHSEASAFARSLLIYLSRHGGHLSEAQLRRVEHMMERERRRFQRLTRPGREEIIAMTRRFPPEK